MAKYKGEILMLITALMWGSGFIGMDIGLEYLTVLQLMAGRFTVAAIILCIVFRKKLALISRALLWKGAVLGSILFLAFVIQTYGLLYTTPSKNAFLTALNVIFVPLLAYIIYKRRFDRFEISAAVIALIGIGFLSLQGSMTMNIGDMLSILCALAFAFDIFYTNVFVKKEDALALTIVQFITAAFLSVVTAAMLGELTLDVPAEGMYAILYLAVFCTVIAYVCQNVGMQYANPTKSAIILSTEALFGTILSVIILHELLTGRMVIGCILIFAAILLAEIKPTFRRKKEIPVESS